MDSKLPINLISYLLLFFDHNEILYLSKLNRKFRKALDKDFLWESKILSDELFVDLMDDTTTFTTWKDYYFNLIKLKRNIKEGKPNLGFKMKPMRGHSNYITALTQIDLNLFESLIISGDKDGNVMYWIINEDKDYEGIKINETKFISEIVNLSFIKNLDKDYNIDGLLVVTEKNSNIYGNIIIN